MVSAHVLKCRLKPSNEIPDPYAEGVRNVLQRAERHALLSALQSIEVDTVHAGEFGKLILRDPLPLPNGFDLRRHDALDVVLQRP
jgi:hypothetical protein